MGEDLITAILKGYDSLYVLVDLLHGKAAFRVEYLNFVLIRTCGRLPAYKKS